MSGWADIHMVSGGCIKGWVDGDGQRIGDEFPSPPVGRSSTSCCQEALPASSPNDPALGCPCSPPQRGGPLGSWTLPARAGEGHRLFQRLLGHTLTLVGVQLAAHSPPVPTLSSIHCS